MDGTGGTVRRTVLGGLAAGALALGPARTALAGAAGREPFRGLFPIASTPVDASDRIDFEALANEVAFLRRGRVPGIVWPQLASGWSVLTEQERITGAEALVAAAKGGSTAVIIGVQAPDLDAVARYARHAERIGADGVICLPPQGVSDDAALLAYYQKVGALTPRPLWAQAVGNMSVDLIVRMAETIPTLRYIKDEAGEPVERAPDLLRRTGGKLHDFSGRGGNTMLAELERGFAGSCPYVSLADVYQAAWEAWADGDRARAFQVFGAIQAANTMLDQSAPAIFVARGIFKPGTRLRTLPRPAGAPAPPYKPARTPEEVKRVLDAYLAPYLRA